MKGQKVVVVVEEAAAARTAIEWAVQNYVRPSDHLTLLHVYPSTKSTAKLHRLRLRGFHLALSFKDLCSRIPEAKVEIIVMEGDEGSAVVSLVRKIGASTLIVGLHDRSFLYRRDISKLGVGNLDCRILAIKQHSLNRYGLLKMEFSQVEIMRLRVRETKTWFLIFRCSLGRLIKRYL